MPNAKIASRPLAPGACLMKISGVLLDAGDFEALEDELNRILENGVRGVAVDCSDLEHISSAALGAFVNLARLLPERRGKLVMAAPQPDLAELIDMLGVRETLGVTEKLDEARRAAEGIG